MSKTARFHDEAVAAAFGALEPPIRASLLALRDLIFDVADELGVAVTEALRWGQPAYLGKRGSTIRLGPTTAIEGGFALFVHCQSRLITMFKAAAGNMLKFDGNRAIVFAPNADLPTDAVKACIRIALTYHDRKR